MAAWNVERFVTEAIESILAQTFRDLELIIVDDASVDATAERIRGFNDPRIVVVRNQEHLGIAGSRNTGLARARASIVAIADSDDVSCPERLDRQMEFLERNPEVGLVGTFAKVIDADGEVLGTIKTPVEDGQIRIEMRTRAALLHPTVALRRELLERVGGYRPKFKAGSDYDVLLRVSEKTAMGTIPSEACLYRLSPSSVSVRRRGAQRHSGFLARRFAEERARSGDDSYKDLLEREFDVPSEGQEANEIAGRYHVFAGKLAGASGKLNLARRHFIRGIQSNPGGPEAYSLLFVSLFGGTAYRWVQRRFGTTEIDQG